MMISLMLYNHPSSIEQSQRKMTEKAERKADGDEAPSTDSIGPPSRTGDENVRGTSKGGPKDEALLPLNRCTLIVVPMSLLAQWRDEIQRFSDMRVYVYYADNRGSVHQLKKCDVVLTSYGTLAAEAKHFQAQQQHSTSSSSSTREMSPLFAMRWSDTAHTAVP